LKATLGLSLALDFFFACLTAVLAAGACFASGSASTVSTGSSLDSAIAFCSAAASLAPSVAFSIPLEATLIASVLAYNSAIDGISVAFLTLARVFSICGSNLTMVSNFLSSTLVSGSLAEISFSLSLRRSV